MLPGRESVGVIGALARSRSSLRICKAVTFFRADQVFE